MFTTKGALSLRAIGTFTLALTIIAIGTLLIMEFSTPIEVLDDKTHSTVTEVLSNLFGSEKNNFKQISGQFKANRIAKLIRKCWRGDKDKSRICYVLRGEIDAKQEDVEARLSQYVNSHLMINTSLNSAPLTIKYDQPRHQIVVDR